LGTAAIAKFDTYLETSVFLGVGAKFMGEIGDEFFQLQNEIEEQEKILNRTKRKNKKLSEGLKDKKA